MNKPGNGNGKNGNCTLAVLQALERDVVTQLVSTAKGEQAAETIVSAMTNANGGVGDDADKAEQVITEARMSTLNRQRSIRLTQIREAIKRYRENTYGICVECGENIPAKRLKAKPEADKCITCQGKHEHSTKLHQHHGSRIAAHV